MKEEQWKEVEGNEGVKGEGMEGRRRQERGKGRGEDCCSVVPPLDWNEIRRP